MIIPTERNKKGELVYPNGKTDRGNGSCMAISNRGMVSPRGLIRQCLSPASYGPGGRFCSRHWQEAQEEFDEGCWTLEDLK